jgi:hypothetical protein
LTSGAVSVASIDLGNADTTLTRSAAGVLAVEGVTVPVNSITNTHTAQALELGHASDTTLTRVSAGRIAVEGVEIVDAIDNPHDLAAGEATMRRSEISSAASNMSTQSLRLTYFTARKTETITEVRTITGGTAAVGATLCQVGIYEEDPSTGDLTLVASIANDTGLWVAGSTDYTSSLSASFTKTRGKRYAVGILIVGASTTPTMMGRISANAAENARTPRLTGVVGSQTDLPASVSAASITNNTQSIYAVVLP